MPKRPRASDGAEPPSVLLLNWRDTGHPDGGGSEVYAERLADGLAGRGHRVTLFTAHYAGAPSEQRRTSGVRVLRRGGRLGVYARAAQAYRRGDLGAPDVIVEVQNGMPFLASLWARRCPVVILVHHVHREQWPVVFGPVRARLGWWLESRIAPWVNRGHRYVAVSEVTRAELVALGIDPRQTEVVHNGAIPPAAHDVRRTSHPRLLVLGRLVPHKRVEIAIAAVDELRAEFPDIELVIAGRGWWEPELRDLVERQGLGQWVRFAGFVSEQERHRALREQLGLTGAVAEGGLGAGRGRGRPARDSEHRLPRSRRGLRVDPRRRDRPAGRRKTGVGLRPAHPRAADRRRGAQPPGQGRQRVRFDLHLAGHRRAVRCRHRRGREPAISPRVSGCRSRTAAGWPA